MSRLRLPGLPRGLPPAPLPATLLVLLLAGALGLEGCGYHLRGGIRLDPALQPVHVQAAPGSVLAVEVGRALRGAGIALVDDPTAARTLLRLEEERQGRRILAYARAGRVRELEVHASVRVRILDAAGMERLPSRVLSLRRELVVDPDQILAQAEQQAALLEELTRDLARQVLARLETVPPPAAGPPP